MNSATRLQGRSVERILRQLATLWSSPALETIAVGLNPRLVTTLGRLLGHPRRIELGPRALASGKRVREVLTHECAHAVLASRGIATGTTPHGAQWRELMALAGYPDAKAALSCYRARPSERLSRTKEPAAIYDHWCPVCQSTRVGRRTVRAWRCAVCVAAGLDGRLEITRRAAKPKGRR